MSRNFTERRPTESELTRCWQAMEASANGVSITDADGVIQVVNSTFTKITGLSVNEVLGQRSFWFSPSESVDGQSEAFGKNLQAGKIWSQDRLISRQDGTSYLASVAISPICELDGSCSGYVESLRDITENRRLHDQIADQRAQLTAFVEHAPAAIAMFDRQFCYVAASRRWIADYALNDRELIGHSHYEIFPNISEDWKAIHARCLAGAVEQSDNDVWRPEGWNHDQHLRWEVRPWFDADGKIGGIVMLTEDITSKVLVEQALQFSEQKFRGLFEFSPVGIVMNDYATGQFLEANQSFLESTGYSHDELLTISYWSLTPPEYGEMEKVQIAEMERSGKYGPYEKEYQKKNGVRYPVLLNGIRLKDPLGRDVIWSIVQDISDRKRMENKLRAAILAEKAATARAEEHARAKAEFLANMSHEIRTPLNAIIGMSEMLQKVSRNESEQEYIETIYHSGDALLMLINDILDFSKLESGKLELERIPVDLRDCVETALELVAPSAARKELDLLYWIEPDVPMGILGDFARLRQVLVNLINNAIKFTEKGEVFIRLSQVATAEGMRLRVSVKDSGIGIPREQQDLLFQSFSQVDASMTRRYGGTGLGLAICHRIIGLMQGRIWVDSQAGCGSDFQFEIPLEGAAESHPRLFQKGHLNGLEGLRILIVDDNATNRWILRAQAQAWGAIPRDTESPVEALSWIDRGDPFQLAILDANMPEMNGCALADALRQTRSSAQMPILLLTSMASSWRNEFMEHGVDAHLTKPAKNSALFEALVSLSRGQQVRSFRRPDLSTFAMADEFPLRILVAEDNAINQRVTALLLKRLGYEPPIVTNGLEVLAAFENQEFDVLLLDVQMPEMDGLQVARELNHLYSRAHRPWIIALTAEAIEGDREDCLAAGMDAYLSKPIRGHQLAAALRAAHEAITTIKNSGKH